MATIAIKKRKIWSGNYGDTKESFEIVKEVPQDMLISAVLAELQTTKLFKSAVPLKDLNTSGDYANTTDLSGTTVTGELDARRTLGEQAEAGTDGKMEVYYEGSVRIASTTELTSNYYDR